MERDLEEDPQTICPEGAQKLGPRDLSLRAVTWARIEAEIDRYPYSTWGQFWHDEISQDFSRFKGFGHEFWRRRMERDLEEDPQTICPEGAQNLGPGGLSLWAVIWERIEAEIGRYPYST